MIRFFLLCLIAFTAINLAGCLDDQDLVPGDELVVYESLDFYLLMENGRYLSVPGKIAQLILVDASWETPDGVTLRHRNLKINPTSVSWRSGNYNYSVNGLELKASCLVEVAKHAQPGERQIRLILPGLAEVSSLLKAKPGFPTNSGAFSPPNTLRVKVFSIHGSKAGKVFTRILKWVGLITVLLIILIFMWRSSD